MGRLSAAMRFFQSVAAIAVVVGGGGDRCGHCAEASLAEQPGDWPRWRGPRCDGVSDESDWSSDWPAGGPPVLWEKEIGVGFSSFAVTQGRLYTMGSLAQRMGEGELPAQATDANQAGEEPEGKLPRRDVLWCLNAKTGERIWDRSYPAELIDTLHEGGPSATPTISHGRGYTVSKQGYFFCFASDTGKILWSKDLVTELGVEMPLWGFSGSALVVGERVIVEAGRTAAFNRITGERIWQSEKFRGAYSSAVSFALPWSACPLIASLNNDVLLVLQSDDGREVARRPFTTPHPTNACTPLVRGDTIFLSSGYNRGCALLKVNPEGMDCLYDNRNMCNHMNSCVFCDGYLYGFDGNTHSRRAATFKCIDYDTGEICWEQRGYGVGSCLLAVDRLIVLSDEGELLVVRPDPQRFDLMAASRVIDGKCWTPPVLCQGLLYVRNAAGRMLCLDLRRHRHD